MTRNVPIETEASPVHIPLHEVTLEGDLVIPRDGESIVIFAHGSGSSRKSSRNQYVASILHEAKIGTLLFDLLTAQEEREEYFTRHLRFDIPFLARRLASATGWLKHEAPDGHEKIGYFGASTGAAAAIVAAAESEHNIKAIVSRGGRPDLAASALRKVTAPTLLIVGGDDLGVIDLNREAFSELASHRELMTIPGATHLFSEPGALEQVALIARDWFTKYL
jgi:putative phosphoribosyl transferase